MAPSISTLICLALFFTTFAISVPGTAAYRHKRETNGERLSRGLPPLRPRKLYNATRTGPALARRSTTPLTALIGGFLPGGITPYCYLTGTFTCDGDVGNAYPFHAIVGAGDPAPQNLVINEPPYSGYDLVARSGTAVMDGDSSGDVAQVGVMNDVYTDPYAEASLDIGSGNFFESAIWTVAPDGTITATWYNPTGNVPPSVPLTFFVSGPAPNPLLATADLLTFITMGGGAVLALKFVT